MAFIVSDKLLAHRYNKCFSLSYVFHALDLEPAISQCKLFAFNGKMVFGGHILVTKDICFY